MPEKTIRYVKEIPSLLQPYIQILVPMVWPNKQHTLAERVQLKKTKDMQIFFVVILTHFLFIVQEYILVYRLILDERLLLSNKLRFFQSVFPGNNYKTKSILYTMTMLTTTFSWSKFLKVIIQKENYFQKTP